MTASGEPVFLVETTLRDGSYAVDFQFTAADTAFIVSVLDEAGVTYIELCHGSGFRNEKSPYRSKIRPAAIDEEHLEAAQKAAKRAHLGVICGPWALDDFDLLARHGFKFARIGVLPDELLRADTFETIEKAKAAGLTVSLNLMQTSLMSVSDVAKGSAEIAKRGADWFYVVDSAGGMMPKATRDYVRAVRESSGLVVGLHAHHNTAMALANSLVAIEAGATRCDATLQGVGRGTGNPSTEQLLLALQALGHETNVHLDPILRLGDLARPLFDSKGQEPTFFASGIAEIHSSNVPLLMQLAEKNQKSAREFLVQVGRSPKRLSGVMLKSLPADIVDPCLEKTAPKWQAKPPEAAVDVLTDRLLKYATNDVKLVAESLFNTAAKIHKRSILHVVPASEFWFTKAQGWEVEEWLGVTVPLEPGATIDVGDRPPHTIVVDPAFGKVEVAGSRVVPYAFHRVTAEAVTDLVTLSVREHGGSVFLSVQSRMRESLALRLTEAGIPIAAGPGDAKTVVSDGTASDWKAPAGGTLVLLGSHKKDVVTAARAAGARVLRPLVGPVVATRIAALGVLGERVKRAAETVQTDSLSLVDAIVAATGDEVVVDDASLPLTLVSTGSAEPRRAARAVAHHRLNAMLKLGRGSL